MADVDDFVDDVAEVAEGVLSMGKQKIFGLAGLLSGIFGFVADVLQPIAPVAIYLFIGSSILLILSLVYYAKTKRGLVTSIVLVCISGVLGIVTMIQQFTDSTEEGIASKFVPGVADVQQSLGLLQEKVEQIADDTKAIRSDVSEVKNNTDKLVDSAKHVEKNSDKLVDSAEKVEAKADEIAEQTAETKQAVKELGDKINNIDGIKKAPKTPEDFYHNAKLYELKGDYGNARKTYKKYFAFNTGKLEPHLRLTDFLRANEGRAGAREEYGLVVRGNDSLEVSYAKLLLGPVVGRQTSLAAFQIAHPEFAPVYYHLSRSYSLETLGKQSFAEKRQEYKWLSKFKELDDAGKLAKYFVDKERLLEWQTDVKSRLKLADAYLHQLKDPIQMTWMVHNHGVNGTISLMEPALDVQVREKGKGAFKSLGHHPHNHPQTGKPMPQTLISLPLGQKPTEFEIRYIDVSGQVSDIYLEKLEKKYLTGIQEENGKVVLDKQSLNICMMSKNSWVAFLKPTGPTSLYFTSILGHRGLLTKIEYGLDKEKPNKEWKFPEYNKGGFAPMSSDVNLFLKVPQSTKFATIQVTFKDGTVSEVIKVINPHAK